MKKRIRIVTSASREVSERKRRKERKKERKREKEKDSRTRQALLSTRVAEWCKREHRIASHRVAAEGSNEERRGGGPFRACGNAFVRKRREDEVDDGEEREAAGRPTGRSVGRPASRTRGDERRSGRAKARTPGRIEKEVSRELAGGGERRRRRTEESRIGRE